MNAFDLDTPALYVDLDILERNLRRAQDLCRGWKIGLRPHTKTHKIPEIARMQLAGGAIGITVAKIGEAEVMPGDDVLVAYPVMPEKSARLREVAKQKRVMVAVDSVESARAAGGVRTLVEIDVGFGRCGVQSVAHGVAVAKACENFAGLFYYPAGLDEEGYKRARAKIQEQLDAFRAAGLEARVVSGGSTPGLEKTPLIPQTTEIRVGTYVFNDASVMALGCATAAECALRMLVTVVSANVPGQCIIDGGSKAFSNNPTKITGTFGLFVDRPWTFTKVNEEHGYVKIESPAKVGEKVWIIPGHAGTTVNMHDEIFFGRGGRVEGAWKVAARGRVR